MERITPNDLDRSPTHLRVVFRGYERAQVLELLQKAALEMSALRGDAHSLKQQLDRQSVELETFRAQENILKQALVAAQKSAEDTKAAAHAEAEAIVEEARRAAAEITQRANSQMNELRWDLERLRLEKQKFLASFRAMLEDQLQELTEMNGFAVVEGMVEEDAAQA